MTSKYRYKIHECDVPAERHSTLASYRDKRRQWVAWLDDDPDHAIWTTLSAMVWRDVAFRTISELALADAPTCLTNSLIAEQLINGHVATQVLSIRRLVDGRKDVISLRRLLMDVRSHFHLLTRENYVCYDGLPYDYEPVMQRELIEKAGTGVFWGHTSGPNAWASSQMAHKQFDKLASIAPENRTRGDRLPLSLLAKIESWLDQSDAERFAKWSHAYLAHAGNPVRRQQIADLRVTNDKITETIRTLARACEALSAYVLYAGGRLNALMPTAQFDQFENLNKPAMRESSAESIHQLWYRLGAERDVFVESVCDELIT